jgi:hypothetical protein
MHPNMCLQARQTKSDQPCDMKHKPRPVWRGFVHVRVGLQACGVALCRLRVSSKLFLAMTRYPPYTGTSLEPRQGIRVF